LFQTSHQFIIKTHSNNIIILLHKPKTLINNNIIILLHKPKTLINNHIITLLAKMPVLIIIIMVINMYLTHHIIILNMTNLNKCKVITIHNITIINLYLVSNTTITKNLIKINLIMWLINMYKSQNNKKILTNYSLYLIMVLLKINTINLKISSKEYKHKKIIMVILKTTKYLILL